MVFTRLKGHILVKDVTFSKLLWDISHLFFAKWCRDQENIRATSCRKKWPTNWALYSGTGGEKCGHFLCVLIGADERLVLGNLLWGILRFERGLNTSDFALNFWKHLFKKVYKPKMASAVIGQREGETYGCVVHAQMPTLLFVPWMLPISIKLFSSLQRLSLEQNGRPM